jgi:hypothetical protein
MSNIRPGLFSNTSAFSNADQKEQLRLINEESLSKIEDNVQRITAAMDLDLESIYHRLDEALFYIKDQTATRIIEDVRDEIYRNLR